jgi:O-antigen ligase
MSVRPAALSFGALVAGSVIVADPAGLAPFGPAKWLVVSTLGFGATALSLWRQVARCDRRAWWGWIVLLALLALSALVNGDAKVALLGHPDRHLGMLTWVLFLAVFCAGQQLADAVTTIARGVVVAALFLGLYSVWELAFGPPIDVSSTTRRLLGPYGSAAYLGAACCLLGPVAVGVAFQRVNDRRWRWVGGAAAVLVAVALAGSGTRAASFGCAVAAVAVVVAVRPSRRNMMWCAVGLLASLAVVAPRLGDVSSRRDGVSGSRVDEWRVAARVIANHPLLGVGPEGYRIAVSEGIDSDYERSHRRDIVLPDRAHSGPLDVTLAGGLCAGLMYAGLVGFVVLRAGRLLRSRQPVLTGVGAAVIGYAAQQLLLFPLAELDPVWWLFGGLGVALTSAAVPVERRHVGVPVLASVTAILMLIIGVLDVAADRLARTALRSSDRVAAIDAATRAVTLRPDNMRYRLVAAEAHLQRGSVADIDAAIAAARQATDWSPDDPFAVDELATAMSRRAIATGDADDVTAALAQWQRLVDRDPRRASWQMQLGRAAALAGDTDRARDAWTIADDLGEPGAADLLAALASSS